MSGIRIRRASPGDLDAVMAIEAAWATTPKWSRGGFERELESRRSYFCVCVATGGAVAGYGGLRLIPPEAQVTTLAVRPENARQGLGSRLMRHLHARALSEGCVLTTLEVSAVNEPALRLYEGLGYRIVGRRRKYYNDGSDALLMTRHFAAPSRLSGRR